MTPPIADVGPPPSPHGPTRRLSFTLVGAFALAALRRVRPRRRSTPVMHRLVAAEEIRFAELCQQITNARRGVEQ